MARFEHVLEMPRTWRPEEIVAVESIDLETKRLVYFDKFCKYHTSLKMISEAMRMSVHV